MTGARLITNPPAGVRQRPRGDGTVRIWWEPSAAARALGFAVVELDANRLTWSRREADRLNRELAQAQRSGTRASSAPLGRTIDGLVNAYCRSPLFLRLAARTQASYRANFRLIAQKWGPQPVRDFSKPVMWAWYETLIETRGHYQGLALIRSMSVLFSHAELIGWRPENSNPCTRLKVSVPKGRRRSANWDEVDALVAAADRLGLPSIGTAILLSLLQGQRQTDILMARRGDLRLRDRIVPGLGPQPAIQWTFTRSKRGNAAGLWLHDEAFARVRPLIEAGGRAEARLLTDDRTGRDFDMDLFGRRWREVRAAAIGHDRSGGMAALNGLQFRDLRRTFGVLSRAGGATKDDAADVLGNSAATNPTLADTYMPAQLDTASRAVDAIQRPVRGKGRAA